MLSDSGASWSNYILLHRSNRFMLYALRLTDALISALTLGLPLQTVSPLISPLILCDLLDSFITDDCHIATHLSRNMNVNLVLYNGF